MIARIFVIVTVFTLLGLAYPILAEENPNTSLENEFIRIVVNRGPNEAGRFSIDTTGGDPTLPSSKGQQLIYGGSTPWTSITTVRVDEKNYVFGGTTDRRAGQNALFGTLVEGPTLKDNAITTTFQYDDVQVTQVLTIARGVSSNMLDTADITYRISNQGEIPHQVGLRVMLDTKLGPNDGAPVRAGDQAITTATTIQGEKIPFKWQAYDDIAKPTVISQGTLRRSGLTLPDKIIFADWGTLADDIWEPTLNPEQGFVRKGEDEDDTAMAMFWNPIMLDAGKSISYTTEYGIGYINIVPGDLTAGISAPAETTFEYERTQEFEITGSLKNYSDFTGKNVTFTLKLPKGLKLTGGSKQSTTLEAFEKGAELQTSWRVIPTGEASGTMQIMLEISSDNIEPSKKQPTWTMQVNVPKPRLILAPNIQQVTARTNKRPTIIPIMVNMAPAVDFYGARFTLTYDPALIKPVITSRGSALISEGQLLDGWEYDTSEDGKVVCTAKRGTAAKLTQAEINLATITFRAVSAGKSSLTLTDALLIDETGKESPVMTSSGSVEISN